MACVASRFHFDAYSSMACLMNFSWTGFTPESLRVGNCADVWGDAVRCSATVEAAVWRNLRRFEVRIYLLPSFAFCAMTLDLRAMTTRSGPHPEWRARARYTSPIA